MKLFDLRLTNFNIHTQAVVGFANVAINSLIVANTAAAGAVLAFLAVLWGNPAFAQVAVIAIGSLKAFAIGTTCAMSCSALSYFAQYCYSRVDITGDDQQSNLRYHRVGRGFHVVAIVFGLIALGSFPYGAWQGLSSLEVVIHN